MRLALFARGPHDRAGLAEQVQAAAEPWLAEAHLERPQDPHDEGQAERAEHHHHRVDREFPLDDPAVENRERRDAHQADERRRRHLPGVIASAEPACVGIQCRPPDPCAVRPSRQAASVVRCRYPCVPHRGFTGVSRLLRGRFARGRKTRLVFHRCFGQRRGPRPDEAITRAGPHGRAGGPLVRRGPPRPRPRARARRPGRFCYVPVTESCGSLEARPVLDLRSCHPVR